MSALSPRLGDAGCHAVVTHCSLGLIFPELLGSQVQKSLNIHNPLKTTAASRGHSIVREKAVLLPLFLQKPMIPTRSSWGTRMFGGHTWGVHLSPSEVSPGALARLSQLTTLA